MDIIYPPIHIGGALKKERGFEEGKAAPFCNVSRLSWLVGASKEGRERLGCTL
jgi:hypothetical protein